MNMPTEHPKLTRLTGNYSGDDNLLLLDTSQTNLLVLCTKNETIYTQLSEPVSHHLDPILNYVFAELSMSPQMLTQIICVKGPGKFSATRLGIAYCQAMSQFTGAKISFFSISELIGISLCRKLEHKSDVYQLGVDFAAVGEFYNLLSFRKDSSQSLELFESQYLQSNSDVQVDACIQFASIENLQQLILESIKYRSMLKIASDDAQPLYLQHGQWKTLSEQMSS